MRALALLALFVVAFALDIKHLAGPPEEFSLHDAPDPVNTVTVEKSFTENIWFTVPGPEQVVYTRNIPVDGPNDFVFSFASPHEKELTLKLEDPNGKSIDLNSAKVESFWPVGDERIPVSVYTIKNSVKGMYKLTIETSMSAEIVAKVLSSPYPNAALVLLNNDRVEVHSHLTSYKIRVGEPIGVVSTIIDGTTGAVPENIQVTSATMDVMEPDGSEVLVPMTDNAKITGGPSSGIFSAQVAANKPGEYVFQTMLQGFFQDAALNEVVTFERSTQHVVRVSESSLDLAGNARLRVKDSETYFVDIAVSNVNSQQPEVRAYAQVWGVDMNTKEEKAVAWISGMTTFDGSYLTLELDANWLKRAGAVGPLKLKGVYVSDMDTNYRVSEILDMDVENSNVEYEFDPVMLSMPITEKMRNGQRPVRQANVTGVTGALLLLHGYCAQSNPWAANPSDFSNAYFFEDRNANLAHQEFALRVLNYAKTKGLDSYSIIGHSQGGAVGAHIRNYYWSGLDEAGNGRHIQSVGTPYKGCTGAGNAANLIKIFGIACGANNDLTVDGMTNWLAGITSEARSNVYYYTTTYEQGNFFGDYCNLAVNLLLKWPNDGTTELDYAVLSGANNMGNTEKQCHTADMAYPAQYHDRSRNQLMNSKAAR